MGCWGWMRVEWEKCGDVKLNAGCKVVGGVRWGWMVHGDEG